jgi:predicted hydrocarbon binding protein
VTLNNGGGRARMIHSHVDEGWVKKWQKEKQPVNFIGQGFILAAFAIINGKSIGAYEIEETSSIVKGDKTSEFTIKGKR